MGQVANAVRADIEEKLEEMKSALAAKALEAKLRPRPWTSPSPACPWPTATSTP